ncbi:MAG: hypothetical protein NC320_02005 [Clostridium sp.]|nr:hypothetical protein [Clostridium sp.]
MKIYVKTPITASYKGGLISIWWYTDDGEFWDYSTTTDDAEEYSGYLQYSNTENHMTLWRDAVRKHISDPQIRKELIAKGYKSIERGRVIFNIRTQSYEIICSENLVNDSKFRKECVEYFNLSGNRYDFEALRHYGKRELTGNSAVDDLYYE